MMTLIKKLPSPGPKINFAKLISEGAIIADVSSKVEFDGGHIRNSINIPVNEPGSNLNKLKDKNKPVIFCCAFGMRSAAAKKMLQANGYASVYNGCGWGSLQDKL
jgi:phage shock protein E